MARLYSEKSAAVAWQRRMFRQFVFAHDHGVSHVGVRGVPLPWTQPHTLLHVAPPSRLAGDADAAAGSGYSFDPTALNTPQLGFPPE